MASLPSLRVLANSDPRVFAEAIKRFGLQVVGLRNNDPLETRVQNESVSAIASVLTEDADDQFDLPKSTVAAMRIAEEHGYIVKVLEEMGLPGEEVGGGVTAPPMAPPKPGVRPKPETRPGRPEPGRKPGRRRKPFNPPRPQEDPGPKACGGM
jgi:hypothetical protein